MEKRDVKKLVFQAYNLGSQDQEERTTQSLNEWFEEIYKLKHRDKFIAPHAIENLIFEYFGTSQYYVFKNSRKEPWIYYRQLMQYLMNKYTKLDNARIGKRTGRYDRTTVIHSIKVIRDYIDTHHEKREEIIEIEQEINDGSVSKEKLELIEKQLWEGDLKKDIYLGIID